MKSLSASMPPQLCSWQLESNISSCTEGTKDTPGRNSFHFREKKVSPWSECRWKMCSSTLIPKLPGSRWRSLTLKIILLTAGAIPSGEVSNSMQWHLSLSPALQNCFSPDTLKSHPSGVSSSPLFTSCVCNSCIKQKTHFFSCYVTPPVVKKFVLRPIKYWHCH